MTVEFRLELSTGTKNESYLLQGVSAPVAGRRRKARHRPDCSANFLRDILLQSVDRSCWVATPDRDPEFPFARDFFSHRSNHEPCGAAILSACGVAGAQSVPSAETQLVAYRAGRRFVARLRGASGQPGLFLKAFHRSQKAESLARNSNHARRLDVRSGGRFRTPAVLQCHPGQSWVAFEEILPRPSQIGYTTTDVMDAACLASMIHQLPRRGLASHTPIQELQTLEKWQGMLARLGRAEPTLVRNMLPILRENLPNADEGGFVPIHRDFYHAQILRNEGGIWLTDWDTLCAGHPDVDLATYLAHHALHRLVEEKSLEENSSVALICDQYVSSGGTISFGRLAWYCSCAIARLACMFRARGWSEDVVRPLFQRAYELAVHLPNNGPSFCEAMGGKK